MLGPLLSEAIKIFFIVTVAKGCGIVSVTIYFIITDEKKADWYLNERVMAKRSSFPMLK